MSNFLPTHWLCPVLPRRHRLSPCVQLPSLLTDCVLSCPAQTSQTVSVCPTSSLLTDCVLSCPDVTDCLHVSSFLPTHWLCPVLPRRHRLSPCVQLPPYSLIVSCPAQTSQTVSMCPASSLLTDCVLSCPDVTDCHRVSSSLPTHWLCPVLPRRHRLSPCVQLPPYSLIVSCPVLPRRHRLSPCVQLPPYSLIVSCPAQTSQTVSVCPTSSLLTDCVLSCPDVTDCLHVSNFLPTHWLCPVLPRRHRLSPCVQLPPYSLIVSCPAQTSQTVSMCPASSLLTDCVLSCPDVTDCLHVSNFLPTHLLCPLLSCPDVTDCLHVSNFLPTHWLCPVLPRRHRLSLCVQLPHYSLIVSCPAQTSQTVSVCPASSLLTDCVLSCPDVTDCLHVSSFLHYSLIVSCPAQTSQTVSMCPASSLLTDCVLSCPDITDCLRVSSFLPTHWLCPVLPRRHRLSPCVQLPPYSLIVSCPAQTSQTVSVCPASSLLTDCVLSCPDVTDCLRVSSFLPTHWLCPVLPRRHRLSPCVQLPSLLTDCVLSCPDVTDCLRVSSFLPTHWLCPVLPRRHRLSPCVQLPPYSLIVSCPAQTSQTVSVCPASSLLTDCVLSCPDVTDCLRVSSFLPTHWLCPVLPRRHRLSPCVQLPPYSLIVSCPAQTSQTVSVCPTSSLLNDCVLSCPDITDCLRVSNFLPTHWLCPAQTSQTVSVCPASSLLTDCVLSCSDVTDCLHVSSFLPTHWLCPVLPRHHRLSPCVQLPPYSLIVSCPAQTSQTVSMCPASSLLTDCVLSCLDITDCLRVSSFLPTHWLCPVLLRRHRLSPCVQLPPYSLIVSCPVQTSQTVSMCPASSLLTDCVLSCPDVTDCLRVSSFLPTHWLCPVLLRRHRLSPCVQLPPYSLIVSCPVQTSQTVSMCPASSLLTDCVLSCPDVTDCLRVSSFLPTHWLCPVLLRRHRLSPCVQLPPYSLIVSCPVQTSQTVSMCPASSLLTDCVLSCPDVTDCLSVSNFLPTHWLCPVLPRRHRLSPCVQLPPYSLIVSCPAQTSQTVSVCPASSLLTDCVLSCPDVTDCLRVSSFLPTHWLCPVLPRHHRLSPCVQLPPYSLIVSCPAQTSQTVSVCPASSLLTDCVLSCPDVTDCLRVSSFLPTHWLCPVLPRRHRLSPCVQLPPYSLIVSCPAQTSQTVSVCPASSLLTDCVLSCPDITDCLLCVQLPPYSLIVSCPAQTSQTVIRVSSFLPTHWLCPVLPRHHRLSPCVQLPPYSLIVSCPAQTSQTVSVCPASSLLTDCVLSCPDVTDCLHVSSFLPTHWLCPVLPRRHRLSPCVQLPPYSLIVSCPAQTSQTVSVCPASSPFCYLLAQSDILF